MQLYVHAVVVGNGSASNPYRPSLYPPALENTAALFASNVFCQDSLVPHPGDGTVEVLDSGEGSVYGITKFLGALCICTLNITDEMWPSIRDATNGFLYGETLPDLKANSLARYNELMTEVRDCEPDLAASIDTSDISAVPGLIRTYLMGLTYSDANSESARQWVVAKLGGSRTDSFPAAWVNNGIANYTAIVDYWNAYQACDVVEEPRSIARLWGVARVATVYNGT